MSIKNGFGLIFRPNEFIQKKEHKNRQAFSEEFSKKLFRTFFNYLHFSHSFGL